MNPNQNHLSWNQYDLSDLLDTVFDSASITDIVAPLPLPENVIFHDPATIVYWDDGTRTVVKCQPGDVFNAEAGLTTAMLKKYMGNDNTFNRVINEWLKRTGQRHS